jgi:hypothetical protein
MARDHLIHAGENTARAREVAEYFQQKISAVLSGQFLSTLGPIHVTYWVTWAVEAEARAKRLIRPRALIDLATRDRAVHGWVRIGVDPETGEEMVWDEDHRVI